MSTQAIKVFISYSHDSESHKNWVRELGEDLRQCGVDASLDLWELGPGADSARFMQDGVRLSDRVVLVCSDAYVGKANEGKGGVGFENMIVTGEMVANVSTTKFIPILRNNSKRAIPAYLGARIYIDFTQDAEYTQKLEELVRELHGTPRFAKPPLGKNPFGAETIPSASHKPMTQSGLANPWFDSLRAEILPRAVRYGKANMEIAFSPREPSIAVDRTKLLEVARKSTIHTFGWPIGVVLDRDEGRPRPTEYGISAEVISTGFSNRENYDFWALSNHGKFFSVLNLFEEERDPTAIFFNTRISRVTEAFQYARNIAERFGYPAESLVDFRVRHTGLKGRHLSTSSPNRDLGPGRRVSHEDVAEAQVSFALPLGDDEIVNLVRKILTPMFELFDFMEFGETIYRDIVKNYIEGRAT